MKSKLNKTVTIYTLLMLIVFPLFMVHTYYDIQTVKMYFYQLSTLACAGVSLLIALIYIIKDRSARKAFTEGIKPKNLRKLLRPVDVFALIFLAAVLVSTFASEWVYEAFWGNMARFMGGYMLSLFVISYFLITRYYVPKRLHIDILLLAGVILCGWAVLDYFSLSPIGFGYDTLFSSTIGNIDVLTSIEVMYVGIAAVMYISEKTEDKASRSRSLYYLVVSLICFMGLECGRTANLLLSFPFLICFIPFYAFGTAKGTLRYIDLLMVYMVGLLIIAGLVAKFPDYACSQDLMGELDGFANNHPKLVFEALIGLALVRLAAGLALKKYTGGLNLAAASGAASLSGTDKPSEEPKTKKNDDRTGKLKQANVITAETLNQPGTAASERRLARCLRIIWGVLGIAAFCVLIYIFYDANTGGHPERYAAVSNLVIFNKSWGTDRGYVWSLGMKYFNEFPLIKKLIGSGPETFAIYVVKYDLNQTLSIFDVSYDSVHNEWLQHLFECGVIGCIGFYGMAAGACVKGLKNGACTAALSFAVMAYFVQSFVNISVPIVLPFVIICLAVAAGYNTFEYSSK